MSYTNQKLGIGSLQLDESEMLASCLDIFTPPRIENQLVKGRDVVIGPVNAIGETGPFEFHMKTSDKSYIFMPVTRIHGGFQIMKLNDNGEEVVAIGSDDYSTINLTSNSLFKQVEVYVNNTQVMDQATATYGKKFF